MIEEMRDLFAYTTWANERMLVAVSQLDEKAFAKDLRSSFASVRDTLVHVLSADWAWLSRWQGVSPTGIPDSWDLTSFPAIRTKWAEIDRERAGFVAGLTEADLDRPLSYRNMSGQPFVNRLGDALRHVVNHSTHHRGQVMTLLRQLGAEGVDTDLITFYRSRPAGEVAAGG